MSVKSLIRYKLYFYYFGEGVERNYEETIIVEHLKEASKSGNFNALYELAYCYLCGIGVEIDYKKTKDLLYKVIEESDGNIDSDNLKSALTIFKSIVGEEFDPVTRRRKRK